MEAAAPVIPDAGHLAAAFGLGRPGGPLVLMATTLASRIWRAETSMGMWAVKEHLRQHDHERDLEVFGLECAAADAGIPAPRPVEVTATGHPTAPLSTTADGTAHVRVWPWVDLRAIPRPTPALVLDEIGRALAALHRLRAPARDASQPHPYYWQPPEDSVWDDLGVRATAVGSPLADRVRSKLDNFRSLAALARAHKPGEPTSWCHLDVSRDNWLLDRDGDLVVIDWDDAHRGDPTREIGHALNAFCEPDESAGRLAAAYIAAGGPGRPDQFGSMAGVACSCCNAAAMILPSALLRDADPQLVEMANGLLENLPSTVRLQALVEAVAPRHTASPSSGPTYHS